MPLPEIKLFQEKVAEKLKAIYRDSPVETEWATMSDETNMYSPRVDIAVGPFATHDIYENEYDTLMNNSRSLIELLITYHHENINNLTSELNSLSFDNLKNKNRNARCLMAIEIENEVSRKHLMGGAINAAALGRIGIVVAWSTEKLRALVKLRQYLLFLGSVGKNTFDTGNLLILDRHQLLQAINSS